MSYHSSKCQARIGTFDERVIERTKDHNHPPNGVNVETRKMRKRAHEEALSSGESTQPVASEALAHVPSFVKANMPRTSSILRAVRRVRQDNLGEN